MDWTLDKSRSICRQLCEKICVGISSGELRAGEKLYSVREVALLASVNPNTVQKSFEELERLGVVYSVPYSGWYVNADTAAASREVELLKIKSGEEYILAMERLGVSPEDSITYLKKIIGKE